MALASNLTFQKLMALKNEPPSYNEATIHCDKSISLSNKCEKCQQRKAIHKAITTSCFLALYPVIVTILVIGITAWICKAVIVRNALT